MRAVSLSPSIKSGALCYQLDITIRVRNNEYSVLDLKLQFIMTHVHLFHIHM